MYFKHFQDKMRVVIKATIAGLGLDDEPDAIVAGGAALAFRDDVGPVTDVDVFCTGPTAAATAKRLVNKLLQAAGDAYVVVGGSASVITVYRQGMLPVQVIVSTAATAAELVARFDLDIVRVTLRGDVVTDYCGKPRGATIGLGPTANYGTPARISKYVARGYVAANDITATLPPYRPLQQWTADTSAMWFAEYLHKHTPTVWCFQAPSPPASFTAAVDALVPTTFAAGNPGYVPPPSLLTRLWRWLTNRS
jgi:hypothetical protein